MTLKHLKIFVAVCECGSVTAAAEKLYLAQPSVSLAIRELEEYYGVNLFDRISRKLFITEVGKQFLNYAIHIVSLFDDMEKEIRNWDTIGTLRIGSSITIGNYLLPQYIKEFKQQYPLIKVQVFIENSEGIEKRVMANEIDFGLIEGKTHNPHIMSEKFMEDELVIICGRSHPLAAFEEIELDQLINQEFILREKGSGCREIFESTLLIHQMEIEPIWESVSTRAIVKAVSEGFGISVLPYYLIRQDLEAGTIQPLKLKDTAFTRYFYIIRHKNKMLSKAAKAFMDLCKGAVVKFP